MPSPRSCAARPRPETVTKQEKKKAVQIIKAIDRDWAFTDPSDESEVYILVNMSRDEHKRLRPEKTFVTWVEEQGFIEFCTKRGQPKGAKREVEEWFGKTVVISLVHFLVVTKTGREVLG